MKKNYEQEEINKQEIILVEEKTPEVFIKLLSRDGTLYRSAKQFIKLSKSKNYTDLLYSLSIFFNPDRSRI